MANLKATELLDMAAQLREQALKLNEMAKKLEVSVEMMGGWDAEIDILTELPLHVILRLKSAGVLTVADLVMYSERQLGAVPNIGRVCIQQIKAVLQRHGLCLGMMGPPSPAPHIGD